MEGTLDVDVEAWDIRCRDRAYTDVCSISKLRSVLLTSYHIKNVTTQKP